MTEGNPGAPDESVLAPRVLAEYLAARAIRPELEDFHAGTGILSAAGDNSDVDVVTPYGKIPWDEVSRISEPEMRELMLRIEGSLALAIRALREVLGNKDSEALRQYISRLRTYDDSAHNQPPGDKERD